MLGPPQFAGAFDPSRRRRQSTRLSKSGTLDLAPSVGGKINKDEVKSAVDEYEKYHGYYGGKEEARKSNYTDMVNKYYDLATSFYEYGWGESFHFAHKWNGESLCESIKRDEHFLALQLGLKPGMKVLDVGCGIGGPLREIARFRSSKVVRDKDLAEDSPLPWYLPLDPSRFSLSSFRLTSVGCMITRTMVKALEYVGLAPQGSERVSNFLEKAAEGLVEGVKYKENPNSMNTTTLSPIDLAKHGEPSMQASATGFHCLKWTPVVGLTPRFRFR
ncbi:hypothetical protein C2845_PM18G06230 [Panicum miliaceum]|uniref:SAM-dependent methyltransferase Erg6/SMT-type domain-containing protein n=1 Tax=Panicum miliaceum TaxID=4540 RepID=A0A3L6PME6_PANMI|nr:hypothetical protein C2845_PM18G06230 [Panicum miliaceum]